MQCGLLEKAVWVEAEPASLAMCRRIVRKSPRSKLKKGLSFIVLLFVVQKEQAKTRSKTANQFGGAPSQRTPV